MKRNNLHRLNVRKDFLSKFLFDRWQNFFAVWLFFLSLTVLASFLSGSLLRIGSDSLSHDTAILLKKNIVFLPLVKDAAFAYIYAVLIGFFFVARSFLSHIPQVFDAIFTNGILKKKKGSSAKKLCSDYNESLKQFENLINGKRMYVPALLLYSSVILLFVIGITPIEELDTVMWNGFHFFPVCWIVTIVAGPLMWAAVGIFMWKMYCVASFMKRLTDCYEFRLKPFDSDGFGGFKPLGQLWVYMNSIAIFLLITWLVLLFFFRSFGNLSPLQPHIEFIFVILYYIVIIVLLVHPMQNYHRIIETEKNNLLKNAKKKVDNHYQRVEKAVLGKKQKELDKSSVEQMKQFHEIAVKIENVSSWPFTSSQKLSFLMSSVIPLVLKAVDYFI